MNGTAPRALAGRARRALGWRLTRARRRSAWYARRGTTAIRLKPTFLVIGAQKSGTTSLHGYLADHPAILCATPKEVHYFDHAYHRGDRWYLAHFPLASRGIAARARIGGAPAVGEVTPAYLFNPLVPRRAHAFDPRLKLIAVLRDPVMRAYSQYQMQHRQGREPLSFEEALANEAALLPSELERIESDPFAPSETAQRIAYVARGRYAEQLERWLEVFPHEQLLVLTSEELLSEPMEAMSRIARFLAIPEHRSASYPLRGVKEYSPMDPATRDRLALLFEPDNRRLERLLGRELDWVRPHTPATRPR